MLLRIIYKNGLLVSTKVIQPHLNAKFCTSQDSGSTTSNGFEDDSKDESMKTKIFEAALPLVPKFGWSKECLEAGAESIGYPKISQGVFEHGGISFVQMFHRTCNDKLKGEKKEVEETKSDELTVAHELLKKRLEMILPYLPHWPQAMALMASPQSSLQSAKLLYELADDICFLAGDKSLNSSWYTKRAAVAGLYITGELSLVQDRSPNQEESWNMLARRIEDLKKVEEFGGNCSKQQQILKDITETSVTMIRNMMGLQSYQRHSR